MSACVAYIDPIVVSCGDQFSIFWHSTPVHILYNYQVCDKDKQFKELYRLSFFLVFCRPSFS